MKESSIFKVRRELPHEKPTRVVIGGTTYVRTPDGQLFNPDRLPRMSKKKRRALLRAAKALEAAEAQAKEAEEAANGVLG